MAPGLGASKSTATSWNFFLNFMPGLFNNYFHGYVCQKFTHFHESFTHKFAAAAIYKILTAFCIIRKLFKNVWNLIFLKDLFISLSNWDVLMNTSFRICIRQSILWLDSFTQINLKFNGILVMAYFRYSCFNLNLSSAPSWNMYCILYN